MMQKCLITLGLSIFFSYSIYAAASVSAYSCRWSSGEPSLVSCETDASNAKCKFNRNKFCVGMAKCTASKKNIARIKKRDRVNYLLAPTGTTAYRMISCRVTSNSCPSALSSYLMGRSRGCKFLNTPSFNWPTLEDEFQKQFNSQIIYSGSEWISLSPKHMGTSTLGQNLLCSHGVVAKNKNYRAKEILRGSGHSRLFVENIQTGKIETASLEDFRCVGSPQGSSRFTGKKSTFSGKEEIAIIKSINKKRGRGFGHDLWVGDLDD